MEWNKNLQKVTNESADILEERGFEVYRGWSDELAQALPELSLQKHINTAETGGDAARRFCDRETAHQWHDNSPYRAVYTLGDTAIRGIIWYGEARRDEADSNLTFAIRLYEGAQGKGAARPFMGAAQQSLEQDENRQERVWLETGVNNIAAQSLYRKFGYQQISEENGRILMTYDPK